MTDKFPVIVEVIERHVVWLEADDQAEAVELLNDDPEWYEAIDSNTRVDESDFEIRGVEDFDWRSYVYPYTRTQGPLQACTECGTVSVDVRYKPWHTEQCSQHPDAPRLRRVEDVELPAVAS